MTDTLRDGSETPPRKGHSARTIVLAVVWALIVVVGLVALVAPQGTFTTRAEQARIACQGNLDYLGALFNVEGSGTRPRRAGPAVFLEWRNRGIRIKPGQERVLLCPNDPAAAPCRTPEERARWDDVDLDAPAPELCSYAVRDFVNFPLRSDAASPEPIAACLHHTETLWVRGGANVLYDDGNVRFVGYEELGISQASELTVGPASMANLLRTLTFGPARRR